MPRTESCGAAGLRDGSLQKTPALRRLSANYPAETSQLPGALRHPFGSEERGGLRKQDGATGRNLGAEVALPCESPGRILAPWTLGTAGLSLLWFPGVFAGCVFLLSVLDWCPCLLWVLVVPPWGVGWLRVRAVSP